VLNACAATGAGFLTAVLWFDLMFDVQTRRYGGDVLPERVLASIAAYYRRVTTEATPMNRLISLVMLATLAVLLAEVVTGDTPRLISGASLVFGGCDRARRGAHRSQCRQAGRRAGPAGVADATRESDLSRSPELSHRDGRGGGAADRRNRRARLSGPPRPPIGLQR